MSQTARDIWARSNYQPASLWKVPGFHEPEAEEWPDLITDRLVIAEKVEWKAIEYPTVFRAATYVIVREQLTLDFDIQGQFRDLADQWRAETHYLSSLSRISMHPAYQRIIGLGRGAVPLILQELEQRGGHWLWALYAITGEDPAPPHATFREAVRAWLDWGRQHHHLT